MCVPLRWDWVVETGFPLSSLLWFKPCVLGSFIVLLPLIEYCVGPLFVGIGSSANSC